MEKENIISRGAEAIIIKKNNFIIKKRVPKNYRLKKLDRKIITQRTRREGKILDKASKLINSPKIIKTNEIKGEITMQYLPGKNLGDVIDILPLKQSIKICFKIGSELGLLHNLDLIHGDLTTNNIILGKNKIGLIDFGLGFHSKRVEDKAVDLHLLEQTLKNKHFKNKKVYFKEIIKGYKITNKNQKRILKRLREVRLRGRYKRKTKSAIKG